MTKTYKEPDTVPVFCVSEFMSSSQGLSEAGSTIIILYKGELRGTTHLSDLPKVPS